MSVFSSNNCINTDFYRAVSFASLMLSETLNFSVLYTNAQKLSPFLIDHFNHRASLYKDKVEVVGHQTIRQNLHLSWMVKAGIYMGIFNM